MSPRRRAEIRIVKVVPTLSLGGLWRHAANLSYGLPQECNAVVLALFDDPRYPEQPLPRGLRLVRLGIDPRRYAERAAIAEQVALQFLALRPDVVHSTHYFTDIYALPSANAVGIPAVRSVHGILQLTPHDEFQKTFVRHDWSESEISDELAMEAYCTTTIAVCDHLRLKLIRYGVSPERVTVLHNAVATDHFRPQFRLAARMAVRNRLGFAPDSFVVGFIGRLELAKNPGALIEISRRLQSAKNVSHARFLVVGSGPLQQEFQEQVRQAGLEGTFLLLPPTKHIRLVYAACDLVLLPSLTEGCPNVLLEAMSQALPVVAAAVGGVPEIIENAVDGLTYPATDLDEATRHLESLARRPEFREALGRRARITVEARFDLTWRQKRLTEIYRVASGR